jgi:hypothetical protein
MIASRTRKPCGPSSKLPSDLFHESSGEVLDARARTAACHSVSEHMPLPMANEAALAPSQASEEGLPDTSHRLGYALRGTTRPT